MALAIQITRTLKESTVSRAIRGMLLTSSRALANLSAVGTAPDVHADPTRLAGADDRAYLTRQVQLTQLFSHLSELKFNDWMDGHHATAPVKKSNLPARQLRCKCLLPLLIHASGLPW